MTTLKSVYMLRNNVESVYASYLMSIRRTTTGDLIMYDLAQNNDCLYSLFPSSFRANCFVFLSHYDQYFANDCIRFPLDAFYRFKEIESRHINSCRGRKG